MQTEHKEELGGLTEALEANSATISTQDLTHLILVGAKTTVAGKELKSLSDESWIVHPAWVFEVRILFVSLHLYDFIELFPNSQ